VIDAPPCQTVDAGSTAEISLLRSSFSDRYFGTTLRLEWELWYDDLGFRRVADQGSVALTWEGYGVQPLAPLTVRLPDQDAVAVLAIRLLSEDGEVVTRNFTTFDVRNEQSAGTRKGTGRKISVPVSEFSSHSFPYQWNAIQGHKTSGGKEGRFEYEIKLPDPSEQAIIRNVEIIFEASAKRLLVRNVEGEGYVKSEISFMHGAEANTERNPNTYYMTDEERHESRIQVAIDEEPIESFLLPDDPADSRGVLSWHYQAVSNKLEEAGSYGYLCKITVPGRIVAKLDQSRKLKLTLSADEGGIALYGRNAGRYPIDMLVRCE
jgi:hypothetical protein